MRACPKLQFLLLVAVLAVLVGMRAEAADDLPVPMDAADRSWWGPVWNSAKDAVGDAGATLGAPARWDWDRWTIAGVAGCSIAVSMLVIDDPVQRFSQHHRNHGTDTVAKYANPFGTIDSFIVLGGFGAVGLATGNDRGERVLVDGLEASIIASGLITPALKYVIGRDRPNTGQGSRDFHPFTGGRSFPSGHATQAFAVASVIATTYDDQSWVAEVSYAAAGLVGFARINGNNHFLSDVLAGSVIGTAVGYEVVQLDRARRRCMAISPILDRSLAGMSCVCVF